MKLVSGSSNGQLRVWNATNGIVFVSLQAGRVSGYTHPVCFSADGLYLIAGDRENVVRVWSVDNGECLRVLQHDASCYLSVLFS